MRPHDALLPLVLAALGGPVALGQAPAPASPFAQWVEGARDGPLGATREYFNGAASLRWKNRMGDYRDARGQPQGTEAFARTAIAAGTRERFVEWDVGELVRGWLAGRYPNRGFFLRGLGGGGTFRFFAREHPEGRRRPTLVVDAGETVVLAPVADTYLDESTYRSLGDRETLRLSAERAMLLQFDVEPLLGRTVRGARLRLYVERGWGAGLDAGVYRCDPGEPVAKTEPRAGLAARYPGDAGIGDDPDVYMATGFEGDAWRSRWSRGADAGNLDTTAAKEADFVPLDGRALRVRARRGGNTFLNLSYVFAEKAGAEPEEAYLRYYLRFGRDWAPSEGGKLPGLAGTYGRAGWGGRRSDGTNGWSARGLYHVELPADNPLAGHLPIGSYVYHGDMRGHFGDHEVWVRGYRGFLRKGRWYCLETQVRLNHGARRDGVLRGWVDGRPAYERTDLRFRIDTPALRIARAWMNVYHGGTGKLPRDGTLYIDNVVIARRYIGPLRRPESPGR